MPPHALTDLPATPPVAGARAAAALDVCNAATRRQFIAMLGAAGLLVACGGNGEEGGASGPEGGTISVTNQFGTFDVPLDPQRVVGWEGRRDLETALALGLSPIAIGSNAFDGGELAPFIDFDPSGVQVIQQTEPNVELIASLRPDLILTRTSNIERLLDEVRPLAPLVGVDPDGPWRTDLEGLAAALNRSDRLSEVLDRYDARRKEVADRHADRIGSAVIAIAQYGAGSGFWASTTKGFALQAQTLGDLGGIMLPFIEEGGETLWNDGFSIEQAEELAAADAILIIGGTDDLAELDASPLWLRLPAVAANRLVRTDFRTNYGSVYAATACLDLLDQVYSTLA
jgi:iron complex transport system substrate-binding protein